MECIKLKNYVELYIAFSVMIIPSDVYSYGTIRSQQIGKLSRKSSRGHWKASLLPISITKGEQLG